MDWILDLLKEWFRVFGPDGIDLGLGTIAALVILVTGLFVGTLKWIKRKSDDL